MKKVWDLGKLNKEDDKKNILFGKFTDIELESSSKLCTWMKRVLNCLNNSAIAHQRGNYDYLLKANLREIEQGGFCSSKIIQLKQVKRVSPKNILMIYTFIKGYSCLLS
ncbi:MAG: hypothetical protein SFY66_15120 [Oculatellaceae cyanobacterium bins.114]|nr:hypothetical protein [Oculatellaceae cyanobacterium bins.114]